MRKFSFGLLFLSLLGTAAGSEFLVTAPTDNGPGSLRQVIADANDGDSIRFNHGITEIDLNSGELAIDKNIAIDGPVTVTRAAGAARFRIFHVFPGANVSLDLVVISNGYADASFGAGILNEGTLTITKCTLTNNFSDAGDGGGGIYSTAELTVIGCTISFNRAGFTTGLPVGYGGGIRSGGVLTIINSTISNNVADIDGGGINCYGTVAIHHSTIADNRAGTINLGPGNAGGIYNGGALQIANTILKVDGFGATIATAGVNGEVHSIGYNLANDDANGFLVEIGDRINTDPMLGPLEDNGGPTFTHRLLPGSPGIDAGHPSFSFLPGSDQCGHGRVSGSRLDIGSFEAQQPVDLPRSKSVARIYDRVLVRSHRTYEDQEEKDRLPGRLPALSSVHAGVWHGTRVD